MVRGNLKRLGCGNKVEVRDLPGTSVGYGGIESPATVGDVTGRLAGHVTRG